VYAEVVRLDEGGPALGAQMIPGFEPILLDFLKKLDPFKNAIKIISE